MFNNESPFKISLCCTSKKEDKGVKVGRRVEKKMLEIGPPPTSATNNECIGRPERKGEVEGVRMRLN